MLAREPSSMKRCCPDCHQVVPLGRRISLEFLGGEIVCSCGAVLHIRHDGAWIIASLLGTVVFSEVAIFLLIVLTILGAVVWLGWWALAVAAFAFAAVGVGVAT